MPKKRRNRKHRVKNCLLGECRTKVSSYWQPMPYDRKSNFIPSSVDCLFNQDYYSDIDAAEMLRSL